MKIESSSIAMAATHKEHSYSYREAMTIEAAKSKDAVGAILSLSTRENKLTSKEAMLEYTKEQEEEAAKRKAENEARALQHFTEQMRMRRDYPDFSSEETIDKIKMLRKMLAALRGEKYTEDEDLCCKPKYKDGTLDMRSAEYRQASSSGFSVRAAAVAGITSGGGSGSTWQKITAVSGFTTESESMTFASTGHVSTADGRNIDFNVEVSMSRAFTAQFDFLEVTEYIKTDPLVINLDSNVASVSDMKFLFDIDSDGKSEKISFAGEGSGFLALDKNGDGEINNGSELFGTKSGDGFRDLSAYDEDHNGWIDENDSVFDKLRVWLKDSEGNDRLINLKEADVGAIYLRNANTQFSLKDDEHKLNAEIKKTGVYLRESTGAVGTLNHLDLAI
ncbi:MAG: hypothetical protein E7241_09680 [Lachnospiraceae bacterium]|jgi:hypothetical protein|nr:hypothetical protein [Lachnospiraceae bacterium]